MISIFRHPSKVCMSYLEHCKFSLGLSYSLGIGCIKAFIHALLPDYYITSTSDLVVEIQEKIEKAGCKKNE